MMNRYLEILTFILLTVFFVSCEHVNKSLELGNNAYNNNHFGQAIKHYNKALTLDSTSFVGKYNKGNGMYKKGIGKDTLVPYYEKLINEAQTDDQIANIYHNIGNTYLANQLYKEAIEAYKSVLRLRPAYEDTRYNLAYAQMHIPPKKDSNQNNQQNQNKQNQDQQKNKENEDQQNKDNKDQKGNDNKDQQNQKDQDQNKSSDQKKDNQNKENGDDQKEQQSGKQQQPQPGKLSKEQAKRLLDHIKRQEKGIRVKVNKGKEKNASKETEGKNW